MSSETIASHGPGPAYFDLALPASRERWRLFVHVPASPPPPGGWPLLVLTDGNATNDMAVSAMRVQSAYPGSTNVEPGVVAAIGYPTDALFEPYRRSFDLTPPPGRSYPPFTPDGPAAITGGADVFLAFIRTVVLPFLDDLAPLDPARRTLFGHSFGGLFALRAMFGGNGDFQRFVAASPTITWEDGTILVGEPGFLASAGAQRALVHLSAGAYEDDRLALFQYGRIDTDDRLKRLKETRTLSAARDLAARLHSAGVAATFEVYPEETHMSVLSVAISRAIRIAFSRSGDAPERPELLARFQTRPDR